VAEPVEDVVGDVADQVGVAEAVLGVAEPPGELVGQGDVGLDARVAGSGLTLPEMARRLTLASTPGDSSMVTISPSKRRMVPRNPAEVMISSPRVSEDCSDCSAFMRRCWGRMSRK
jgi:hypothetical protein